MKFKNKKGIELSCYVSHPPCCELMIIMSMKNFKKKKKNLKTLMGFHKKVVFLAVLPKP